MSIYCLGFVFYSVSAKYQVTMKRKGNENSKSKNDNGYWKTYKTGLSYVLLFLRGYTETGLSYI